MTLPCYNPQSPGNSPEYHTGRKCSVRGCDKPAGTWWNRELCYDCNVARLKKLDAREKP